MRRRRRPGNHQKWWQTHLVEGEAGVVGRLEGGEAVGGEGADGVATARGKLLADGVDAVCICTPRGGAGQVKESQVQVKVQAKDR